MNETESDPHFTVRPRYHAVEVTEEYVRSIAGRRHPHLLPKFDERRGTIRGVEILGTNREPTGEVAQPGEYIVFTPSVAEIYWDRGALEAAYEIEGDA